MLLLHFHFLSDLKERFLVKGTGYCFVKGKFLSINKVADQLLIRNLTRVYHNFSISLSSKISLNVNWKKLLVTIDK